MAQVRTLPASNYLLQLMIINHQLSHLLGNYTIRDPLAVAHILRYGIIFSCLVGMHVSFRFVSFVGKKCNGCFNDSTTEKPTNPIQPPHTLILILVLCPFTHSNRILLIALVVSFLLIRSCWVDSSFPSQLSTLVSTRLSCCTALTSDRSIFNDRYSFTYIR